MAKKKDPAVSVLNYFRTADVGQAQLVLGLAKEVVKERTGGTAATTPKTRGRRATTPAAPAAADTAPAGRLPNT